MKLILGSASPRRLTLLAQIGVVPDEVRPADIDETPLKGELARPYCLRMAREKAEALPLGPGEAVLTGDTTVAVGRRILGKPKDRAEAEAFLRLLSGRRHRVITAIAFRTGDTLRDRVVETRVQMKRLNEAELTGFLDSNEWEGKAGAYGIHGLAGAFFPWMSGSYSAVVGLPLAETTTLLQSVGLGPAA